MWTLGNERNSEFYLTFLLNLYGDLIENAKRQEAIL
jgi:hypothetical protein